MAVKLFVICAILCGVPAALASKDVEVGQDKDGKVYSALTTDAVDPFTDSALTSKDVEVGDDQDGKADSAVTTPVWGNTNGPTTTATDTTSGPCGGILEGSSGVIESPNFPSTYPNYAYCEWSIRVEGSSVVRLELLTFELEGSCYDYVQIRDGPGSSDPVLVQYCEPQSGGNGTFIRTTGSEAYVLFRSDSSVAYSGFQIYWEAEAQGTTEVPATTTTQPGPSGEAYAFSVSLSQDTAIDDSPLVFDTIHYNQQGAYNSISGVFEPQIHGLYFLTTSCLSTAGTNFHVYIVRGENDPLCKSVAADSDRFVGTCSSVAELFPGDQVRVTGNLDHVGVATGAGFSGFSGYLIARLD